MGDAKTNVYHITYFSESKTACLYFGKCNFRCLGCIRRRCSFDIHLSPSSLKQTDKKAAFFLTIDQILNTLRKEKIDKIIFLGGEPTLDSKFVFLTKRLKEKFNSFNILLTNGYILPELSFLNEVCLGIKAKTSVLHSEYTGKNSEQVFENLNILNKSKLILRTESMFIPDYIGWEETEHIAKAISRVNPNIPHRIDGYIPVPGTKWRRPTQKEMEGVVIIARKYLKDVTFIKTSKRSSSLVKTLA